MKIFLQHRETSLFFQQLDSWTASYHDAFDFRAARKAIEFANLYGITNVQIMVVFAGTGYLQMLPFEMPAPSLVRTSATL